VIDPVNHLHNLDPETDSLSDLLQRAALVARRIVIEEEEESGTFPSQKRLIARIRLDGRSTVNELAREMGVRPAVVSRMVSRFERYGYVESRSLRGRRGTPVVLTHIGRSVRPLAFPSDDVDERLSVDLTVQEVVQLKKLLQKVVREAGDARIQKR
jgi:DNA-binding MarR family transcriptional regulator